ncbi:MAG: hypothetical protein ACO3HA_09695, partial [Burkholderiales bacterium]
SAFPIVAGPILWFIALEQGAVFAAQAAVGTLSAVLGMLAFGLSYAWAATRVPWVLSLPLAYAGYALTVALLEWWNATLLAAAAGVLLGLWFAPRFYPRLVAVAAPPVKPPRDMLLRMFLGALLVLAVTYSAAQLGPSLSGIFAMFPVMGTVLVLFTHRSAGAAAAVQLLRGMVLGFYAFAAFCAVLAWMLTTADIGMAFLWALAAAGLVQLLSRLWMSRHGLVIARRVP